RGLDAGAAGVERGVLRSLEAPARFYTYDFPRSWDAAREALELLPAGHPKRTLTYASATFSGMQQGKMGEFDAYLAEMLAADPANEDRSDYLNALGHALVAHAVSAQRV